MRNAGRRGPRWANVTRIVRPPSSTRGRAQSRAPRCLHRTVLAAQSRALPSSAAPRCLEQRPPRRAFQGATALGRAVQVAAAALSRANTRARTRRPDRCRRPRRSPERRASPQQMLKF
ncbi:hypothetical protein ACP4OV_023567 [Aristida adscensionis]